MDAHRHRISTDFEQTLLGGHPSGTAGCWVCTSPSGYVTAFGEAGVPTPGLEGGVGVQSGAIPESLFDGKVQNLGLRTICLCPQIRFPPP